jgi:hypothetical protein
MAAFANMVCAFRRKKELVSISMSAQKIFIIVRIAQIVEINLVDTNVNARKDSFGLMKQWNALMLTNVRLPKTYQVSALLNIIRVMTTRNVPIQLVHLFASAILDGN